MPQGRRWEPRGQGLPRVPRGLTGVLTRRACEEAAPEDGGTRSGSGPCPSCHQSAELALESKPGPHCSEEQSRHRSSAALAPV